jgi:hypothetical protein
LKTLNLKGVPKIRSSNQFDNLSLNGVWIKDDALARFDQSKNFDTIISSQRENWGKWIKEKIDEQDFQNRALKFDKTGETEINLAEMNEHVTMD